MNLIDFGMNLQEAGDAPLWDHTGGSSPTGINESGRGEVRVESGISYETISGLMDRRHKVGFARGIYGGYQAIMWDEENQVYRGASESRKDGQAAGYWVRFRFQFFKKCGSFFSDNLKWLPLI